MNTDTYNGNNKNSNNALNNVFYFYFVLDFTTIMIVLQILS